MGSREGFGPRHFASSGHVVTYSRLILVDSALYTAAALSSRLDPVEVLGLGRICPLTRTGVTVFVRFAMIAAA